MARESADTLAVLREQVTSKGGTTAAALAVLEAAGILPTARFVNFFAYDDTAEGLDMIDALHPQTILAYDLNDEPLKVEHGAPLRVRVERQLGYKMPKYLRAIEVVDSFAAIDGGRGGYWEDNGYDWYAGI